MNEPSVVFHQVFEEIMLNTNRAILQTPQDGKEVFSLTKRQFFRKKLLFPPFLGRYLKSKDMG